MNYISKKQKHFASIQPGVEVGAKVVKVGDRGDISFALRKWKKGLKDSGKLETLKARQEYIPPSVTKRIAKERAKFLAQLETERNA
jgi:ribosomal protein S21